MKLGDIIIYVIWSCFSDSGDVNVSHLAIFGVGCLNRHNRKKLMVPYPRGSSRPANRYLLRTLNTNFYIQKFEMYP